ncbi:MAG: VCBS repeat-containing protein [Candidatus Delongbacteria bacterium]|nr:VCBS repeat-containing protein [Candidatus Delongbacteria bacterium]
MKSFHNIIMTALILSFTFLNAQTSVITVTALPEEFGLITQSFGSIDVEKYSVPAVTDIDGNGLLDILVGDLYGKIIHYVQADSASADFILSDSLFNGIDVGGWASPAFTDLDGNGLKDLLIGNLDGRIHHYQQIYPDSVQFVLVTDFFNSIGVSFNAAPAVADVNRDGLLDLLIGEDFGHIFHYVQNSAFSTDFTLVTGSFNSIDAGFNAAPVLTDLDKDGLIDMFIGNYEGYICHYEQFDAYTFDFVLREQKFNSIDIGYRSKPFFSDIDFNGYSDLLIGENDGNINRYEIQALDSLDFGTLALGQSKILKYVASTSGEEDFLHIESLGDGFEISLTGEEFDYWNYLDIFPNFTGMCSDTVFVRYKPNYSGSVSGSLEHSNSYPDIVSLKIKGNCYLEPPVVNVEIIDTDLVISWETGEYELSYNVYSSDDPYGEFICVAMEVWDSWWSEPLTETKKFYYVTVNDFSQPVNKNKDR